MRIERTKNASRNIAFGVALKILQIILPFLMRTAMIYFMGVQYLGLNSLFASVLQVLNLAELGVGNAMVYSMYKPIVDDDCSKICALMKLYKTYYRIIGLVIASLGIILLPVIPHLIKSDLPEGINLYILYLINLGASVLTYWLFAYKNALLIAHQRNDVSSKITLITTFFQFIIQLIVLTVLRDYYIYCIVIIVTQIINNIVTAVVASKMYPQYVAKGKLSKEEIKQINLRIKDLFTSKIGAVVVNSADTVVISAFLGLTVLAVYQNYYFIMTSVIGVVAVVFSSCTAGIGNSIIVETKLKNYLDLNNFTFMIAWIAGFCGTCFLCLYQPFITLWVGNDLLLGMPAVICLCIYYYTYEINQLLNLYKDAAGIWHEDRFRPLVTAIANLGMNLITVQFWGIYGVILSTVISMLFVGMPWLLHNIFSTLFDREYIYQYIKNLFRLTTVSVGVSALTYMICEMIHVSALMTLLVRLLICVVIPNTLFYVIYHRLPEFKNSVRIVDHMTKGKLKLTKIFN